uniref:Peptidase S24/S26A/S26B/S26C domain-containing protein n=1 Tax=Desulfobacca acetoxidans TaxID=60893 RepID=A0A7V6A2N6_9BACT
MSPLVLEVAAHFLQEGYGVLLKTRGHSMAPLIRSSGLIQVVPVHPEDLLWGDIVVYRQGDQVVAHRLVGRRQRGNNLCLATRGDAFSWQSREEISAAQVLGRVAAVRSRRGREIRIDTGWGRVLSLALAATWPLPQGIFLVFARLKTSRARLWGRHAPGL